jgi:predicted amidohydrolase
MAEITKPRYANAQAVQASFNEVGDGLFYKWRASKDASEVVRISVSGTFTGTVSLRVCEPGTAEAGLTTGYEADTFTAPESIVFEVGGNCDILLYCSAYTDGTINAAIYRGLVKN